MAKKDEYPISACVVCRVGIFAETDGVCSSCAKELETSDPVLALQRKLKKTENELESVETDYYNLMASIGRLHKKSLKIANKHASLG